jgi:hypothetical protein
MSGWPWMRSTTVTVDAEEEEENENDMEYADHRPMVSDCIVEYRELIDQLKADLSKDELYDSTKHDDLWILRFLLSHKKDVQGALVAAQETLRFRKEYNLDDKDIREVAPQDITPESDEPFQHFLKHGVGKYSLNLVVPHTKRCGVIFFFDIVSIDTHQLAEVDQEDWIAGLFYVNEWQFQWNDYITRTTGRLTKSVHIIDVADISLSMYDSVTQDKYTTAGKKIQNCYPQGVQAYFVCHAPFWIETPWKLMKPLLPLRVVSKLDFLNPKRFEEDRGRLLQYIPEKYLPERFGGKYSSWPPTSADMI